MCVRHNISSYYCCLLVSSLSPASTHPSIYYDQVYSTQTPDVEDTLRTMQVISVL